MSLLIFCLSTFYVAEGNKSPEFVYLTHFDFLIFCCSFYCTRGGMKGESVCDIRRI